jgi:hypothetical protein
MCYTKDTNQGNISGVNMVIAYMAETDLETKRRKAEVKPYLRKMSNLIRDVFSTGIPGYPDISVLHWGERFGKGLIKSNSVQQWINQVRTPSLESIVLFGILLKQSGANIGVFDLLLAAADGIYHYWIGELKGQVGDEPLGDYSDLGNPEEADIAPPVDSSLKAYKQQSYADRLAAMPGLLAAFTRDLRYQQMKSEPEVVQALVREVKASYGNDTKRVASLVDVPKEWIDLIVEGKLEEAKAMSTTGLVLKLADKVPDLDGQKSNAELFACLLPSSEINVFAKEIKRRQKQQTGLSDRLF